MLTYPTNPSTNSVHKASIEIVRQQVNIFIIGWLIANSGSNVQITKPLWDKLYAMQEKILAHVFDGMSIDSTFTEEELRCCNETVSVFGRHNEPTTVKHWPEIHHDVVPKGATCGRPLSYHIPRSNHD